MVRDAAKLKRNAVKVFPALPKLNRIIAVLGKRAAADMLGVERSQLKRIARSEERASAELARRITDIEYVLDCALQVMHADQVAAWLVSEEPLLQDRRPLKVLRCEGAAPLTRVLDAIYAGALV